MAAQLLAKARLPGPRELARRVRSLRASVGRQVLEARTDAGVSRRQLAAAAGIDPAHLWRIESGSANASLEVLMAISACLGSDLGVRLFPGHGPRLHDRFQAPMLEALLRCLGPRWLPIPELPVPLARGVIDLVLRDRTTGLAIACEAQSELRRLEQVLRRLSEKAAALAALEPQPTGFSTVLLLRSTRETRALARLYESTLAAAFPARTQAVVAALSGSDPWPGSAIVWVRLERGAAAILDRPPRKVRLGR
jgi:transcriptional regulator with XRE-family HTH domain